MTETDRKGTDGAERAASAYAQWLEGCERLTDVWLRMMSEAGQGRAFTDAMRGVMDATANAGGAARPGDQVTLPDGRSGVVDTAELAEDLRDAKCTVLLDDAAPLEGDDPVKR